jgi:hypothetical protein
MNEHTGLRRSEPVTPQRGTVEPTEIDGTGPRLACALLMTVAVLGAV